MRINYDLIREKMSIQYIVLFIAIAYIALQFQAYATFRAISTSGVNCKRKTT